ncbi:hypothetical protein [Mariniluteicoccus endophyticus]
MDSFTAWCNGTYKVSVSSGARSAAVGCGAKPEPGSYVNIRVVGWKDGKSTEASGQIQAP